MCEEELAQSRYTQQLSRTRFEPVLSALQAERSNQTGNHREHNAVSLLIQASVATQLVVITSPLNHPPNYVIINIHHGSFISPSAVTVQDEGALAPSTMPQACPAPSLRNPRSIHLRQHPHVAATIGASYRRIVGRRSIFLRRPAQGGS